MQALLFAGSRMRAALKKILINVLTCLYYGDDITWQFPTTVNHPRLTGARYAGKGEYEKHMPSLIPSWLR